MIDLDFDDGVYVLRMRNGENLMGLAFLEALNAALDEVEKSSGPAALVSTGEGRFYSNGLDLAWMQGEGVLQRAEFGALLQRTLARLVAFPLVTVAALNGHAFATGAVLAMTQDFRVMGSNGGLFCLPEIDIQVPFSAGELGVVQSRMASPVLHEALTTGRRYAAAEALQAGIVDAAVPEHDVLARAIEMARALGEKHRPTLVALKRELYKPVLEALEADAKRLEDAH